jgi:DNA-binding PadR family transcriptional regulator
LNPKLFRGALLQTVLLSFINAAPQGVHGYAMFMAVQKRFGVRLGASTLYPELSLLEQQGLICSALEVVGGKTRRKYCLTSKGRQMLATNSAQLRMILPVLAGYESS